MDMKKLLQIIDEAEQQEVVNEEARDAIRDFMGMGYSRAQAEAEARKMYPDEFPDQSYSRPRRPQQKPELVSMTFYNVPDDADKQKLATSMGLKQTKAGKWYLGKYTTSGAEKFNNRRTLADKEFGAGKEWTPKKKADEGYTVLPAIDRERYGDRESEGLEGPFMMRNGQVLYYDKRAGKYYNPDVDMYVSDEEYFAMDKKSEFSMSESDDEDKSKECPACGNMSYTDGTCSDKHCEKHLQPVDEAITISADSAAELAELLQMAGMDHTVVDAMPVDAEQEVCPQCGDPDCTCPPGECSCGEEPEQEGPATLNYRYETDKDKIIDTIKDRLKKKLGM